MAAARRTGHVAALLMLAFLVASVQDTRSKTISSSQKIGSAFISALKSKRNAEYSSDDTTDSGHKLAELSFRDAIRVPVIDPADYSMTADDTDVSTKHSRKHRSTKQDYTPENSRSSAEDSLRKLTSRPFGNSYPATMMPNIPDKVREILPRILKNILDFIQIYRGFLSRHSPNLMKLLEMPSLEKEISRSEDLDYATNSGTSSDLSYRISKGNRLAELYSYNLNELIGLLRIGSRNTVNVEGATGEVRGKSEGIADDVPEKLFKGNEYFKFMGSSTSRNTLHNINHSSDSDMSARLGPADESDTEVEIESESNDTKSNSSTNSQHKDIGAHIPESDQLASNRSSVDSPLTPSFRSGETAQTGNSSRLEIININKTAVEKSLTEKPLQEISNSTSMPASLPKERIQPEKTNSSGQKGYSKSLVTNNLNTYSNSKVPNYPTSKTGAQSIYGRGMFPWKVRGKRGTNLAELGVSNSEEEHKGTLKENNIAYGDFGFRTDHTAGRVGLSIMKKTAKRAVGAAGVLTMADSVNGNDEGKASEASRFHRKKRGAAATEQGIGGYGQRSGQLRGVAKSNTALDRASGAGREHYGSGWKQQPSRVPSPTSGNFQPATGETSKTSTGFRPGTSFPNVQSSPPQWSNTAATSHLTGKLGSVRANDNLSLNERSPNINSVDIKWLMDNVMEAAALLKDISPLLHQLSVILPPNTMSAVSEGKIFHPELNIPYVAPGKDKANELSSAELKAQISVNAVLSNFLARLNNILQGYRGNEAINNNQVRLLILELSQHRLLNMLLYKNLIHLASLLGGTSNMKPPDATGIYQTPVVTGQPNDFLIPRMLNTYAESSKEKQEKNSTATNGRKSFKQKDVSNSSDEIISNSDLESRMFNIGDMESPKMASWTAKDFNRPLSTPFPKHFSTNAPNKRPENSKLLNSPYPQKEAWQSWAPPPGFMHSYQRNMGDLSKSSDDDSNGMDSAVEGAAAEQDKEGNKKQSESVDESGESQAYHENSGNNDNLSSIRELLQSVGIDSGRFAEDDIQKISILFTKISNDTLKRYVESQKSATDDTSSPSTTLPCVDSSSQKPNTSSTQQSPPKSDNAAATEGQEKPSIETLNTELTRYAAAAKKFLHTKGFLRKLRSNEIMSLCKALVENSGRYPGDWQNSRDSFSAVILEYIERLFDSVQEAHQEYQAGRNRQRRYAAEAAPHRDKEDDKPEPRFSQGFPQQSTAFNTYNWDARTSATWELQRIIYSNEAEPHFLQSFFKHCQFTNNGILKCTPLGAEYRGKYPKEINLLLKHRAGKSIIPQSCPPLFGVH